MKTTRLFKPDKWNKMLGSRIPALSLVEVVRFMPRRRVLVSFNGELINTMLWCLEKGHFIGGG